MKERYRLTPIPIQAQRPALTEEMNQAMGALREIGALGPRLGEQARLTSRYSLAVNSVTEVNEAAAQKGTEAAWTAPWTYAATWSEGTATVTVSFSLDPRTAMATAATIESFCRMAASNGPGCAA